jgi:hypothetical protein
MKRTQHVGKGKLNKCILTASVDTVLCLINCILDVGSFRFNLSPYEIEIRRCTTGISQFSILKKHIKMGLKIKILYSFQICELSKFLPLLNTF